MLEIGQTAPIFALPDADMEIIDIAQYKGKNHIVLFFYPRDDAPTCTFEATSFSDHEDEFSQQECVVFGINRDDCIRHAEFRDKHGISIRLLSDVEGAVCKQYAVWQIKEVDGVKKPGIVRSTFVIDKQGILRFTLYGVNTKGHVQEVLRVVKELNS